MKMEIASGDYFFNDSSGNVKGNRFLFQIAGANESRFRIMKQIFDLIGKTY